jgi:parallel beta-helix repeat protein
MILLFVLGVTVTQAGAEVFTVDINGGGNYSTIQEAVNNAQNGDMILVNPGVYQENVAVNKELMIVSNPDLAANQTNRTYVIGAISEKDVFDIYSNNVIIEGLYIIGGPSGVERGEVGINLEGVQNCSLINNALVLNDIGISLNGSKSNYIDNNLVSLGEDGIVLVDSNDNILSNNTVTTNANGISLNNSMNNTLDNNAADSNMVGVLLEMSERNMLTYNIIMRNADGIRGDAARSNIIINNSLFLNDIGMYLTGSADNSIYENRFSNFNNAEDEGTNIWNSSSKGNFWHNYTGQDADGNGIGDTPYAINQTTGSIDYMPVISANNSENVSGNVSEDMGGNTSENMGGNTSENMGGNTSENTGGNV